MKLLLPREVRAELPSERELEHLDVGPYFKRSYTILEVADEDLTLDFVVHEIGGPASLWVKEVTPGQEVIVTGPGPVQMLDPRAKSFLLAGDMTGLSGIRANLRRLPSDAVGSCFVEVVTEGDIDELGAPPGIQVRFIVTKEGNPSRLATEVRAAPLDPHEVSVWAASEYSIMKELRAYFTELKLPADRVYVSSYWKRNATDEEHKEAKRREEAEGAAD